MTRPRTPDDARPASAPAFQAPQAAVTSDVAAQFVPTVQPAEVQALIVRMQAMTDQELREALADNALDEEPTETAAFLSDQMVERTYRAADALVKNAHQAIERKAGENDRDWKRRAQYFMNAVAAERRRAKVVVEALRARQGRVMNPPNARGRAARDLQRKYPVEYLELVRHHEAEIRAEEEAKKAAKRKAANARKKRKRQEQQAQPRR